MASGPAVYIQTYGCSFNASDGETMAGVLAHAGYRIVNAPEGADVIILNSCTVKDRTYWEFEKRFGRLREAAGLGQGPPVIVAGCIPKTCQRTSLLEGVSVLGPDTVGQIEEVVRGTLAGQTIRRLTPPEGESSGVGRPLLPIQRQNPSVEILPIASGCLGACTFCQTRLARGRLHSFRPADIVQRARQALGEGVRELWVTAQDTGAYGKDRGYPLTRLLGQLCELDGDFRIRLGMCNPIWIWQDLAAYLDVFEHPRMFQFLHVPVQSGSDRVLSDMKRGNTAGQFNEICQAFSSRFPDGGLMTDIIVGYPSETEECFAATLALIERVKPAATNLSKFSPRPGTAAARLNPLPPRIVSERSRRAGEAVRRVARAYHEGWRGMRDRVLVSHTRSNGVLIAHNGAYRPVIVHGSGKPGEWLDVEYVDIADFHLKAKML